MAEFNGLLADVAYMYRGIDVDIATITAIQVIH